MKTVKPAPRADPHETLFDLLHCGLSYAEARSIPYEDALCLLHVHARRAQLSRLDAEAARLASLPLADPHAVQRELRRIELQARALLKECSLPQRNRDAAKNKHESAFLELSAPPG
jgi:hypothetical protein